ncbi:MAG: superoxide dismutase family protein [Clostridia bacterium]|nr:superoxide dismutase family protein [Clostridia bacterium]
MYRENRRADPNFAGVMSRRPQAMAQIAGSAVYPDITGTVRFYTTPYGVLVVAQISGLPLSGDVCREPVFGFHIHEGTSCTGNSNDPFFNAGLHYNPRRCLHPYHAGDLPPLFGADGQAFSAFLTNRFAVPDIVGKTVIIHGSPDDFMTQPAGNSGVKIACGVIVP